jgi:hypothetical protein
VPFVAVALLEIRLNMCEFAKGHFKMAIVVAVDLAAPWGGQVHDYNLFCAIVSQRL